MEILKDNASNWTKLSPMITPKSGLSCCLFNDFIFECGGTNNTSMDYFNTCSLYNFNNNEWKSLKHMNTERGLCNPGIGYDYTKNRIIVSGGFESSKLVEYYELNRDTWINMPNTKYDHAWKPCVFIQKSGIIIIFGDGYNRNISSSYVEMFDPRSNDNKWCTIDTLRNITNVAVAPFDELLLVEKQV